MRLLLLAVGTRMPAWVEEAFAEYQKRMPREARIELVEIKPEKRGDKKEASKTAEQAMAAEAARINAALPKGCLRVVLDEHGQSFTSTQLAHRLQGWLASGRDVTLIIGGADGLAPEIKRTGDLLWSLSALTLPHPLVRIVLAEQLYRAMSILQNHPYHRE
jgi:23S rRNA (pseudouridine1915-N3)-methyltransferase